MESGKRVISHESIWRWLGRRTGLSYREVMFGKGWVPASAGMTGGGEGVERLRRGKEMGEHPG